MSDSIKRRFAFSFGANIAKAILSLCTGLVIARGLGPSNYGNLAYLLGSFWALRALLDMGSASAFYTFISQQHRGFEYYFIYIFWVILQFAGSIILITIILPNSIIEYFWFGQQRELILLAMLATYFQNQLWQTVVQIYESVRLTVRIQLMGTLIALTHFALMALFFLLHWLSIEIVLWAIIGEYFIAFLFLIYRNPPPKVPCSVSLDSLGLRRAFSEYLKYCRPMLVLTISAFFYEICDRWLLQKFSGPSQQAYYQVASQLSAVSLLAGSSILNIFWKEIAEANSQNDHYRVAKLYHSTSKFLVIFGMGISCFLMPWSRELITVLLGESYYEAWPAFLVMLCYPFHQILGQINATFLMATRQIKPYVVIGSIALILSIPFSFVLLAPSSGFYISGLGMGALGLALKIVLANIISTNVQSYWISRLTNTSMDWSYQILAFIALSLLGVVSYFVGSYFLEVLGPLNLMLSMSIAATTYFVFAITILLKLPAILGLQNADREFILKKLKVLQLKIK